ncbi:hypothetical protein E4U13_000697 [Claviceps humidiphila]|uniref:Uncharacterized protein n=1 Tax=Claviceps humidiphila TaxID=1294629 RepID=A0A9P7Q4J1_9HYPO|nr:hypothetical protein E4U13_000697 [Claviceps humidiphila]
MDLKSRGQMASGSSDRRVLHIGALALKFRVAHSPPVPITKTTSLVGLINQTNKARIFYQNGTDTELGDGVSNILTDHDFPLYPVGLTLTPEGSSLTIRTAHLIDGPGDRGLSISMNREGLRHITKINEGNGTIIPPDCIRVLLTPECYASSRE